MLFFFYFFSPDHRICGQSEKDYLVFCFLNQLHYPRIIGIENCFAALSEAFEEISFFPHDSLNGSQSFQVRRADIGNHSDIRRTYFSQSCDFTGIVCAQFQYRPLMAGLKAQKGQWQPDFIVKISDGHQRLILPGQDLGDQLAGGCFPVRPCYGHH